MTPEAFEANDALRAGFSVLATNKDRQGKTFVSLMESKDASMPIYGSQFHPEKPLFEWWPEEVIQHTGSAVFANSYFARFFLDAVRRSTTAPPENLSELLIYNYEAVFADTWFMQVYRWGPAL